MIITKLEAQKKNAGRINLYIDDVFFCGISADTLVQFNLYVKKEIDQELLDSILNQEIYNRIYDRALSYITGSMKSQKQLRDKLKEVLYKKKGIWFKEDYYHEALLHIDNVISKLESFGYINDLEYARVFVENRNRNKPRSILQLKQELVLKGISKNIIDDVLAGFDTTQAILDVYNKKYNGEKLDINDNKKVGYLARKGFSYDDITKLVNILNDTEE